MTDKTIEIITTSDTYECDTCGMDWAEGGYVLIDGEKVLEVVPSAYCLGGTSASESELLVLALSKIGVKVRVDGEFFHISNVELSKELL
jgi:hypothetical protein